MKPDAEMFFLEPAALLKKHYNQVNRLLEFQKDHRVRLVSFHRKVLQKYKALEKLQSSTVTHIKELEKKYAAAKNRIQELENENKKLRIMISSQGGGTGAYPVVPCSSPADLYRGTLTPKKTPPKINGSQVSPGETRISPGRLTLLKTNQGSVISSHGQSPSNMPVCTSAHAIPFTSVQFHS
ncbi:E3 SUMO-protein ligase RNF212-like [Homarus americanus]|uniref:E3 SUMO-protein ligase RNF212-like n=1 Tax=Homarus americanus TaxID=6706 RepID=A0A8J5NBN3_HOMAM|nr:E3 SUMO-protein ligase RNF212-like [Homarus americanus]